MIAARTMFSTCPLSIFFVKSDSLKILSLKLLWTYIGVSWLSESAYMSSIQSWHLQIVSSSFKINSMNSITSSSLTLMMPDKSWSKIMLFSICTLSYVKRKQKYVHHVSCLLHRVILILRKTFNINPVYHCIARKNLFIARPRLAGKIITRCLHELLWIILKPKWFIRSDMTERCQKPDLRLFTNPV